MTADTNIQLWGRRATVLLTTAAVALGIAFVAGPADADRSTAPGIEPNTLVITRALDTEVFDGGLPAAAPKGTDAGFARPGQKVSVEVESRYDTTPDDSPHDGSQLVVGRNLTITLKVGAGTVGTGVLERGHFRTRIEIPAPAFRAGNVVLTASGPHNSGLEDDDITVTVAEQSDYFKGGLGAGQTVGVVDAEDRPCVLGPDQPTCVTLSLSAATTQPVLMSVSTCAAFLGGAVDCLTGPGNNQALVAQSFTDVPQGAVATAILSCDKSLCGAGGVPSFIPWVDKGNTGRFTRAEKCPAKGEVGGLGICVDLRQSRRTNAGDLLTYILFDDDARYSH